MKELNRKTANVSMVRPIRVLQFGQGNFLRGFVDWMLDILNEKTDFNGDIQIVQPRTSGQGETINTQEGLYHTVLMGLQDGREVNEIRLITSVRGLVDPFVDYTRFLELGQNRDLRFIVSNTTEAGIKFDPNDTEFIRLPKTFPGKLTALLYARFNYYNGAHDKGCVIIPVELIPKNGTVLKETIINYINLWKLPKDFLLWINDYNVFCNTLVDRIVPGYPKEEIESIEERLGYMDQLVVKAEPYHLWAIEAPEFVQKELPFVEAGLNVIFVKDLTPYRTRKVRILNGAHTAMVPIGYLKGYRTVKECVETEPMASFIRTLIFKEIIPTLDLPKRELEIYAEAILERFQNPYIRHELSSIALNSVSKFKVRVLPSILKYHELKHGLPKNLIMAFAALIVFYRGHYDDQETPLNDDSDTMAFMKSIWESENLQKLVDLVLSKQTFWGTDLSQLEGLKKQLMTEIIPFLEADYQ